MIRAIKEWREKRKHRKLAKYADEYGYMDAAQLDRMRKSLAMGRRGGTGRG